MTSSTSHNSCFTFLFLLQALDWIALGVMLPMQIKCAKVVGVKPSVTPTTPPTPPPMKTTTWSLRQLIVLLDFGELTRATHVSVHVEAQWVKHVTWLLVSVVANLGTQVKRCKRDSWWIFNLNIRGVLMTFSNHETVKSNLLNVHT